MKEKDEFNMKRAYEIIGAPFGFAANKSGSRTAPDYLRENGLNIKIRQRTNEFWGSDIEDFGNVEVDSQINELYKSEKTLEAVKLYCEKLNDCVYNSYVRGKTPIIVGGDHSISVGTVSATSRYLKKTNSKSNLGLIWVDAHADLNNLENGNIHGKSVAISLGYVYQDMFKLSDLTGVIDTKNIMYIGIRDLMPNEYVTIQNENISLYGMDKIDKSGIGEVIKEIVSKLEETTDGIFLSFDIDACDGGVYRGCATPEVGGLTAREAIQIIDYVSQSKKFMGADIVEYSPEDDTNGNTNQLVIKLIDTLVGYRM